MYLYGIRGVVAVKKKSRFPHQMMEQLLHRFIFYTDFCQVYLLLTMEIYCILFKIYMNTSLIDFL